MKKLAITAAALAMAFSASASILTWGLFPDPEILDWNGNDATVGSAYAAIYLLAGENILPTYNNGAWDMKGATYLNGGLAFDDSNYLWGDPDGTDYADVVAGAGAEEQYFAIFLTSEATTDLSTFVGDGKYFVSFTQAGDIAGAPVPGGGTLYTTDVSIFAGAAQGSWTEAAPVPEPTTVALLALGLAAVGLKRKVA